MKIRTLSLIVLILGLAQSFRAVPYAPHVAAAQSRLPGLVGDTPTRSNDSDLAQMPVAASFDGAWREGTTATNVEVETVKFIGTYLGYYVPGYDWICRKVAVQQVLSGPPLSAEVHMCVYLYPLSCLGYRDPAIEVGDTVEVYGKYLSPDAVSYCGSADYYFVELDTVAPARIDDLTATPGAYPGDVVLNWTAPGDDGDTGTSSSYTIRYDLSPFPIDTEDDWQLALDLEGEPTPLAAGSPQSMTVSLIPGHIYHFAIKAEDDVGNESELSNLATTEAPGRLVTEINWDLKYNPSSVLGQEVTLLVIPARTDDWSLTLGDLKSDVEAIKYLVELWGVLGVDGIKDSFVHAVEAVLVEQIVDNWLQMRSQVLWGLHKAETGDRTLLMWDPEGNLMANGVPYIVTGTVQKKTFWDITAGEEDYFYYLDVQQASDMSNEEPSPTHPYYPIPEGYEYVWWKNVETEFQQDGDPLCTMGLVSERYEVDGHYYVRIQLLKDETNALPVRVTNGDDVPQVGSMALYCGIKHVTDTEDLHPADLGLDTYLDTTEAGSIRLLQGKAGPIWTREITEGTLIVVETGSPVDIHLTDALGNHVGVVYDGSGNVVGVENEIPDVEYVYAIDDAPECLVVGNPVAGTYTVTLRGTATGTYSETVEIWSLGQQTYSNTLTVQPIQAGQEDVIVVDAIPAAPTGLVAELVDGIVHLDWDDNAEVDLLGYNVYRTNPQNMAYQKVNSAPVVASTYVDTPNDGHVVHTYRVTAQDVDGNESGHLAPVETGYGFYLPLVLRGYVARTGS